jgi:hypothetical protein
MTRLASVLAVVFMCVGLAGCGQDDSERRMARGSASSSRFEVDRAGSVARIKLPSGRDDDRTMPNAAEINAACGSRGVPRSVAAVATDANGYSAAKPASWLVLICG